MSPMLLLFLLLLLDIPTASARQRNLHDGIAAKVQKLWNTTNKDKPQISEEEYAFLRRAGTNEVSHSIESAALRNYKLRDLKWQGWWGKKKYTDLASLFFPGVESNEYQPGEVLRPVASVVHTRRTQIPYRFTDLPFCEPPSSPEASPQSNLGSKIWGAEYTVAPFTLKVKTNKACTPLCEASISPEQVRWLRTLVDHQYRAELVLDGLPLLVKYNQENNAILGYPIGFQWKWDRNQQSANVSLFNNFRFIITYQENPSTKGVRITGFDMVPVSIQHNRDPKDKDSILTCNPQGVQLVSNQKETYLTLPEDVSEEDLSIIYSYEVLWYRSDEPWEDRWDVYFMYEASALAVHHFGVVNSFVAVLVLSLAVIGLLRRALAKDLAKYKKMESKEDTASEQASKWKLIYEDVFRPPSEDPLTLCVLVGSGCQLGAAVLLFLVLNSALKIWTPTQGKDAFAAFLYLYAFCGPLSGYVSARFYKLFGGADWQYNAFATAVALPGVLLSAYLVINIVLSVPGASTSVGIGVLLHLQGVWLCIHSPLVLGGSFRGFHSPTLMVPIEPATTQREIPEQVWYMKQPALFLVGGLMPFGCVYLELHYALIALFWGKLYIPGGIVLCLTTLFMFLTAGATSIFCTFMLFLRENHRWWWNSFWCSAGTGFYIFFKCWSFCTNSARIEGDSSEFLTIIYVSMCSGCFGLVSGSCGFIASFVFTRKLYGAYDASMETVGWYKRMEDEKEAAPNAFAAKGEASESESSWEVVARANEKD